MKHHNLHLQVRQYERLYSIINLNLIILVYIFISQNRRQSIVNEIYSSFVNIETKNMNKMQLPSGYSKNKLKNISVLITKNEVKDKSDLEINLTKSLKLKIIIVNLSQKYY